MMGSDFDYLSIYFVYLWAQSLIFSEACYVLPYIYAIGAHNSSKKRATVADQRSRLFRSQDYIIGGRSKHKVRITPSAALKRASCH
ncbi:uncharacterized protein BDV14DRAFT_178614 [Aspergillus stella-maris]|uniref:uncharacterized protein n=1 Tax=Aspergillus stella-maris TaxID=1810926 RepID=UPI003CCCB754